MIRNGIGALIILALCHVPAFAESGPIAVKPIAGPPADTEDGFTFNKKTKKTRRSLSGIACPEGQGSKKLCLVVFDEEAEARYLKIGRGKYSADNERVVLGPEDTEIDAEAAATDGKYYYVTGSHSLGRKTCEVRPNTRQVIRFKMDPGTGRAVRDSAGQLVEYASVANLWGIMETEPSLNSDAEYKFCLQAGEKRGIDIEGLAIRNNRLYFGFRGPTKDTEAKIMAVNAEPLFGNGDVNAKFFSVSLGENRRGIRDMQAVSDGILILAGPDDQTDDPATLGASPGSKEILSANGTKKQIDRWIVALWDGNETHNGIIHARPLAELDLSTVEKRSCDTETKPEAMTVLSDEAGKPYKILILSDGMCDGGPLLFEVPK